MHYRGGPAYTITRTPAEVLRKEVRSRIVSGVPTDSYRETSDYLPLRHDTSVPAISLALLPHTDGSLKDNAVYVLECLTTPAVGSAICNGISTESIARYQDLENPDRVLYVGVTSNLLRRINQHINVPVEDGANFTGLYRPIRVLEVGWFRTYERADKAEALAADLLRERFPDDFVAYPG
jgi:predicted GIY-YIG superfamily endonuclease